MWGKLGTQILLLTLLLATLALAQEKPGQEETRDLERERKLEEKCLECHGDEKLQSGGRRGERKSIYVDKDRYRASIHTRKDLTCFSCHPDAKVDYHPREGVAIKGCGDCHDHEEQQKEYADSIHGRLLAAAAPDAPDCQHCHGNHYLLEKASPAYEMTPEASAARCLACHPTKGRPAGALDWLGTRRVVAHAKVDLSDDFTQDRCTMCHYGSHTHKTPDEEPRCGACHMADYDAAGRSLGNVHLPVEGVASFFGGAARGTGFFLSLLLAAALALPLGLATLRFLRQKPEPVEEKNEDDS